MVRSAVTTRNNCGAPAMPLPRRSMCW